jgi:DNA-binding transcriptional ArsR family regulator
MSEQRASPLTVSVYNPSSLKKGDLIRGFVARQGLLEQLLEDLRREGRDGTPQHQLIIGQRGLGKTTLLQRLAYAVEDNAELGGVWMPLVFPEEQYNVASLGDFWLNCADALSDALDRRGDSAASEALDERVQRVPRKGDRRAAEALRILLQESERIDRRLLLLVDNADIILDRLTREQEWEFRRVLSEERRIHIVGASSRFLEAIYEHGRAFYDFFQVHELKGLDESEMFSVLGHLAAESQNAGVQEVLRTRQARMRALHRLTGGNPRTVVLLFRVLAEAPDADVQRDIEQLLDLYTPLYKARFEDLPPQAQQVVDAMAIHWDPVTAAELTELVRPLPVSQVSAQLKRLEDFGVVEKTPWFGEKKAAFQIAERFFNIWYLMRTSRRNRRRLIWLVKFLEAWFDQEELSERARGFLKCDPESMGQERFADLALAYAQAVADKYLRSHLQWAALDAAVKSRFGLDLGNDELFWSDGRQTEDALRALGSEPDFEENEILWLNLVLVLWARDRNAEAKQACQRLARLDPQMCFALVVKLAEMAFDRAPNDPELQSNLAMALIAADKWDKSKPILETLASGESASVSPALLQIILLTGHVGDAIEIFERTGAHERWRPAYEALKAVQAGTPDYLRRVAPEVREVAMEILREIDPG